MGTVMLVLALFFFVFSEASISSTLILTKVQREVDLRQHVEEAILMYTFRNSGSQPEDHVVLAVPEQKRANLAYIQAYSKSGSPLPTDETELQVQSAPTGTAFFKVLLNSPLKPESSVTVTVHISFVNILVPKPAAVPQGAPQLVLYSDNAYAFTPYRSQSQTVKFKLGTTNIKSYTRKDGRINSQDLDYSFTDVAPFSHRDLSIHFESKASFMTMKTCVKEIEVSHWGNVAVDETYLLSHSGPGLEGGFSRVDFERFTHKRHGSFNLLTATLPVGAKDLYYRDVIGNISSSHARNQRDGVYLELQPRFPLWGGWKTDFNYGYNAPAENFLRIDQAGKFVLNMTFGSPFVGVAVDDLELRVILPEGATNIEWLTPFSVDSSSLSARFTYLDLVGRPMLILRKNNTMRLHNVPFLVSYNFSSYQIYREPLMMMGVFLGFFFLAGLSLRIELGISDGKPEKSSSSPAYSTSTSSTSPTSSAFASATPSPAPTTATEVDKDNGGGSDNGSGSSSSSGSGVAPSPPQSKSRKKGKK